MAIEMRVKMESRSQKYDINRPILDLDTNILDIKFVSV